MTFVKEEAFIFLQSHTKCTPQEIALSAVPANRIPRNATRPRREILLTSGLDIHPACSTHFVAEQKFIRLHMQPGELARQAGCITRLFPVNYVRWRGRTRAL